MEQLREQLRSKMYQDQVYQQNLLLALSKNQPMPSRPKGLDMGNFQQNPIKFSLPEQQPSSDNNLRRQEPIYQTQMNDMQFGQRAQSRELSSREMAQRIPIIENEKRKAGVVQYPSNSGNNMNTANFKSAEPPKRSGSMRPEPEKKLNYNGSLLEADSKFVPIDILDKYQGTNDSALTLSKVANFGLRPNSSKVFKTNSEPQSKNYVNINTNKVNSIRPLSQINSRQGRLSTNPEEENGSNLSINNELSKEIDRLLKRSPNEDFSSAHGSQGKLSNNNNNNNNPYSKVKRNEKERFNMVAHNILQSGSNLVEESEESLLNMNNNPVRARGGGGDMGGQVKPRILSGRSNFISGGEMREPGQYSMNTDVKGIILDTEFPSLKDQNTFFPDYDERLVQKYKSPIMGYNSANENNSDTRMQKASERRFSGKGRRIEDSQMTAGGGGGLNTLDIQNLNRKYDERLNSNNVDAWKPSREVKGKVNEMENEEEDEELKKLDRLLMNYKK